MKKLLGIVVLGLLWCNVGFAEIIFKNCNLSPNFGMIDFYVYLEKNEIEIHDQEEGDIRIFAIDHHISSSNTVTASKLIALPTDNEISNWPKKNKIKLFNYLNNQIDEKYILDYSIGLVTATLGVHVGADQEMIETVKGTKPVVETNCRVVNLYQKQEVEEKVLTQKSNLISTTHFTKKQKKKYDKYMIKPEMPLCINYINNYGWFADQDVRLIAIKNRGIDCNKYQEAAYYEDKKRKDELAESGKKLFDSAVDGYYGVDSSNNKKNRTHCTTTDIGGKIQVFCKDY